MSMRKPVIDFIANQLAPSDLATVMYPLTPVDAAVLTRNHQGIINAVEKFEGRKYNYDPINDVESGYVYKLTPDAIEIIRRQVTLSAIRGMCTKLGSLREGRKSLILLSEGFNATLPPQMRSNHGRRLRAAPPAATSRAIRSPATTTSLEDRAQFSAELDMNRELQDVWDACNRNNTAIYAVDPRGLAVGGFDITANISMTTSQSYLNASIDTLRDARGEHRRPRDRQPQRSRRRHEADHPRLERVLPGRLQLDAGADRRQVPRDQGARQAARRAGARAPGLLGLHGGRRRSARSRDRSRARRAEVTKALARLRR